MPNMAYRLPLDLSSLSITSLLNFLFLQSLPMNSTLQPSRLSFISAKGRRLALPSLGTLACSLAVGNFAECLHPTHLFVGAVLSPPLSSFLITDHICEHAPICLLHC